MSHPPPPDLFLTEVLVEDWARAVEWFVQALRLKVLLRDFENRYALLEAASGRVALKEAPFQDLRAVRLVFRVDDVDAEHARLCAAGIEVSGPADHPREPFREARLTGPGGLAITLFSWKPGGPSW